MSLEGRGVAHSILVDVGLPGWGMRRKEWRGSEHPSVSSMQTRALAALLVVVAVCVARSKHIVGA